MSEDALTLETVETWTVAALKEFIRKRGLPVTGTKKVLAARAYVAWELHLPVLPTPVEVAQQKREHMQRLLETTEGEVPHPNSLLNGWLDEDQGIALWPPTMIQDIALFLDRHSPAREHSFTQRLLSDYKEQKAFSYFASNFIMELLYHPITQDSNYCFMKAKVCPSQRITSNPHVTWILINKHTGYIQSAHCSCFAGLGQTCNHMAAILLKIDFCWQHGYIKKPVTSEACTWKQPGKRSLIVGPQLVRDMEIVKPKIGRTEPKTSFHTSTRREFMPHQPHKGMTYADFLDQLRAIRPSAVVLGEHDEERYKLYKDWDAQRCTATVKAPPNVLTACSTALTADDVLSRLQPISSADVESIELATRDQGMGSWKAQRLGRITASIFKDVYTRVQTGNNPSTLVQTIMGFSSVPDYLPAIKYGHRMESVAVQKYINIMRQRKHKQLKVDRCGLFVCGDYPYIGATPDRLVSCGCCGDGLLEVKCPYSCAATAPSHEVLDYLVEKDELVKLNPSHRYYYQVQGQLAVTGRDYCDFFVFSQHGHYIERIMRDSSLWQNLLPVLTGFFREHVAHKIAELNVCT